MLLPFLSCRSDSEVLLNSHWKWGESYRLWDGIDFKEGKIAEGYSIENDTVYKDGEVKAVIDSLWYRYDHYMVQIRSTEGEKGLYFEK